MRDTDCQGPYIISACVMAVIRGGGSGDDIFQGMIDAGANVSIGTKELAVALGATIYPANDDLTIGMAPLGWIHGPNCCSPRGGIYITEYRSDAATWDGHCISSGTGCVSSEYQRRMVCNVGPVSSD